MLTKSLEELKKSKKALPFEALSVGRQRTRIIKDAISQINTNKFKIRQGRYMISLDSEGNDDSYGPPRDLQTLLLRKDNTPVCQVCAKGALFASCVINTDKVKTSQEFEQEKFLKGKLSTWFSDKELDMIETAFEKRPIVDNNRVIFIYRGGAKYKTELGKKCVEFGKKYKKPTDRLLAILNNVLENGTFKP